MAREFSDGTGDRWTASESGFYFDDGEFPEDETFSERTMADVEFRSERGARVTGYIIRGALEHATDEKLRAELAAARRQYREVQ